MNQEAQEKDDLRGFEVYTSDGGLVGRVFGYLDRVPEDVLEFVQTVVDPVGPDGALLAPPRVLVEGRGLPLQTQFAVPIDQLLDLDVRARRITLRETMAQLRQQVRDTPPHS